MSIAEKREAYYAPNPPPLEAGDRLSRDEFERRYHAMPSGRKAELLRGMVYMPSPVRIARHATPHSQIVTWLGIYAFGTPGVESADNGTIRLGPEDEPQPDAMLRILPECGGQAGIDADDYLVGAPELAVEVASSSVSYDTHVKKDVYEHHGVREYLIWRVDDRQIDWYILRDSKYVAIDPGADGIYRSEVFPGLWLDPQSLINGDGPRLLAVLQDGLASPEHRAFVRQLS